MKQFLTTLSTLALAALTSCSTSFSPQSRIEANPAIYDALTSVQKQQVARGEVSKGMTKPAVFLAWGGADSVVKGQRNDDVIEKWAYTAHRPYYANSFHGSYGYGGGYGSGYGRRHGRFGSYYGGGFGPTLVYREVPFAVVEFKNEKVTRWERSESR